MWHRLKRWLYLTHRWIGIATCLLFVLWFASGLVMIYVPFPALGDEEQLKGLSPIAWEQVEHGPFDTGPEPDLREIQLEMRDGRPIWRLSPWDGEPYAVWADSGLPAQKVGRQEAERIAEGFGKERLSALHRIYSDQWSVPGSYDVHRPLWKAELAGTAGRTLYVSSTSGEIVLDTDAHERFWNWLGSIPHWLYPRALREEQPLWRQVVMWVSGPCILVAVTGFWIGLMRLRTGKKRFKGGRITPYRGWMKWHHVSGLVGSVFMILWIFSGWLSVDPWRLFASEGISALAYRDYAGGLPLAVPHRERLAQIAPDARQVVVSAAAGHAVVRVRQPGLKDHVIDGVSLRPLAANEQRIVAAAIKLVPDADLVCKEILTRPDAYWYAVGDGPTLPVLRLRFADHARTWIYLDPVTGELLGQADSRRRTYRWLFNLFHRWDLNVLLKASPARDLLIWLMSCGGMISSVSAVYIAWVRLRRPRNRLARPDKTTASGCG